MLRCLQIRDFALIELAELELSEGFTVVTGETGAGKSMVLDALSALLGERADPDGVRHGAKQADITAIFDISRRPQIKNWLSERDLATSQDDCQLRRVISVQGRSRAYINGISQPLTVLKQLAEQLVTLHGQHASQQLLERDYQRQLLDELSDGGALAKQVALAYREWRAAEKQLQQFEQLQLQQTQRALQIEDTLARFSAVDLKEGELEQLLNEQRRLVHGERLLTGGQRLLHGLDGENQSLRQKLLHCQRELRQLVALDAAWHPVSELLEAAQIQLAEAARETAHYLAHVELDSRRLEWIENRLSDIENLARRERLSAEGLFAKQQALTAELQALQAQTVQQQSLEAVALQSQKNYEARSAALRQQREHIAQRFSEQVTAGLRELGMQQAVFTVMLSDGESPSEYGTERVEFLIATHAGMSPRALSKVASGGELSRIALAIQVHARDNTALLRIFDEIDTGIGGAVAEVMGRQLRTLGQYGQVLCITHLAQVAACGHHHFLVQKYQERDQIRSELRRLDSKERIQELARMLGGVAITEATRHHAREMLSVSNL